MTMSDRELIRLINDAERNSAQSNGNQEGKQERVLNDYLGNPYGNEMPGKSRVVARDVSDLIESDMPALARIFLGAGDPVEFQPTKSDEAHIQEIDEKQRYVSHIIKTVTNSFRTQHDWLKSSELYDYAMLEYGLETDESSDMQEYTGLSEEELAVLVNDLRAENGIERIEITRREDNDDGIDIEFKIDRKVERFFMRNIPIEDTIISANSASKDEADIVGKWFRKSRGQLIQEGFDEDVVMRLPAHTGGNTRETGLKAIRFDDQGGEVVENTLDTEMNELVEGMDVYVKMDYDEDGILERRHVVLSGVEILENEPFDHVPYAIISSMLMPNSLAGRSRAELAQEWQKIHTHLRRNILDNINAVSYPRSVVSEDVDLDDMMDIRLNGIIRTSAAQAAGQVVPLSTQYIGGEVMQVVQYLQGQHALTTGSQQANQALTADNLHKETATRFEGMQEAAAGKLELVARVIAEVGYRDLWEGIAWFASHFQDTQQEFYVLGKQLMVNPANWRFDHNIVATVGTGAGDDDKIIDSMGSVYSIQKQLKDEGNELVDNKKLFNTLNKLTKAVGQHKVSDYFNDPEQPQQILQAQNELMKQQIEQMSQQLQNPLAEAEQVKAQASLAQNQQDNELDAQKFMAQIQQDQQKMALEQQKFMAQMQLEMQKLQLAAQTAADKTAVEVGKLELEHNQDLEGGLV